MATSARIDELHKKFVENPRRYFAPLANEYRKAGDLTQAIAICRQHLADQPGHMSGHIVYGQALFENKDFGEARVVFEAALALDPENLIALRHLGDIARDAGDYPAARTWYKRVLDADPRNEDIAAQVALVAEAEANAAASAAAAAASAPPPKSLLPATIITAAVSRSSVMAEAKTMEIAAVARPSQIVSRPEPERAHGDVDLPSAFETAAPVPQDIGDVAPPRMSLMGLDLETMAGVEQTPEQESMPTMRPSLGFDSGRFDGNLEEVEANPLAGLSGVAQNDESSAAGLMSRSVPEAGVPLSSKLEPEPMAPAAADLPSELLVPSRNTPPVVELGLAPQPPIQPTGLWDTAEEVDQAAAAHAELDLDPAFAGTTPPPSVAAPVAPAFELADEAPETAAPTASGVFATETMAELYVTQGYREQAIDVYRQLLQQRPGDATLQAKIDALEAPLAPHLGEAIGAGTSEDASAVAASASAVSAGGPSVRDFFGALARWQPALDANVGATVDLAPGAHAAAPIVEAAGAYDLDIFPGAHIADADEHAARLMAALYPEPLGAGHGNGAAPAMAAVPDAAAASDALPGNAARPASSELSLDQVFTEPQPSRPSRRSSASFSFDHFFSQAPGGTTPRSATPQSSVIPIAPAVQSPEEIEQFQSWLGGLKKK